MNPKQPSTLFNQSLNWFDLYPVVLPCSTSVRLLVEILIFGALIYLAWDTPLKQRADQVQAAVRAAAASKPPAAAPEQTAAAPVAPTPIPTPIPLPRPMITAPPPRGAWMWDAKRQSALDRPAYGQTQSVQRYQDPYGRSYWIDANGVRHYDQ